MIRKKQRASNFWSVKKHKVFNTRKYTIPLPPGLSKKVDKIIYSINDQYAKEFLPWDTITFTPRLHGKSIEFDVVGVNYRIPKRA
jgi:hypothetical protein